MRKTQIKKHLAENNIPESWIVELEPNSVELLAPDYERDAADAMSQVLFTGVPGHISYSGYNSITFEFESRAKLAARAVRNNLIDQLGAGYCTDEDDEIEDEPRGFYFWDGSEELYTTDAAEFLSWVIG